MSLVSKAVMRELVENNKETYVQKEDGKGLSSNDYTTTEKNKLAGLSNYTHPNYTSKSNGLYKVTVDSQGHVSDATAVQKKDITDLGIPAQDTTYEVATSSKHGLMSKEDKTKLDGVPSNIQEQLDNKAPSKHEHDYLPITGGTIKGDGITPLKIESNDQTYSYIGFYNGESTKLGEIGYANNTAYVQDGNYMQPILHTGNYNVYLTDYSKTDHTHDGLMSQDDKSKLDSIETGANNYTHPSHTAKSNGLYKITVDSQGHVNSATTVAKSDITALGIPSQDTTYSNATTSKSGLMSSNDKTKLDSIPSNVQEQLDGKASSSHKHDYLPITGGTIDGDSMTPIDIKSSTTQHSFISFSNNESSELGKVGYVNGNASVSFNGTIHPILHMGNYDSYLGDYSKEGHTHSEYSPTDHTHDASNITQDSTHRFVSDAEKSTWNAKADTSVATSSNNGLMSSSDKTKLDGIESNANNYVHPSYTAKANGFYKVTVDGNGHVSNVESVTKGDITKLGIPSQDTVYTHPSHTAKSNGLYKVTVDAQGHVSGTSSVTKSDITALGIPSQDTTYEESTTSKSGLMSSTDKAKLNNIENEAEVNLVNDVQIDGTTILEDKVANIPLANADDYGVVKVERDGSIVYVYGDWYSTGKNWYAVPSLVRDDSDSLLIDPIYLPLATTTTNGIISKSDKAKLDGIEANATKVVVENELTSTSMVNALSSLQGKILNDRINAINTNLGNLGAGDMLKSTYDIDGDGIVDDAKRVNGHTVQSDVPFNAKFTDTTYSEANTSVSGLMSATDKVKLNGIEEGAEKNVVTGAYIRMNNDVPLAGIIVRNDGTEIEVPALDSTYKIQTTLIPKVTTTEDGLMKKQDKAKLDAFGDASTYALKSEISRVFKYIGTVMNESDLPESSSVGDVYNIYNASKYGGAGMNVVYTGTGWDALGEKFSIDTITTSFIDGVCL